MSEFNPSLEKAWECLEKGEISAARDIAERERCADPEDPESLFLLANCCRNEGEAEKAIVLLEETAALAADWAAPEFLIAEILAGELDRAEDALVHAEAALDRAEEEDEFLEAIILKAGLEIELGKEKAARRTLAELPPAKDVALPAEMALELGHLFLDAGDREEAERRFRILAEVHAEDAEAWYGIGLCAEDRGDETAKRQAWVRVHDLDTKAPLETEHLTETEMATIAEAALKELPSHVRSRLENVPILIVDLPVREEVEQGLDPRLLGLFVGAAYSDANAVGGVPLVTQILLFRKNLERMAVDAENLREQIRITLLHETGHFFGMSEEDLAQVGLE